MASCTLDFGRMLYVSSETGLKLCMLYPFSSASKNRLSSVGRQFNTRFFGTWYTAGQVGTGFAWKLLGCFGLAPGNTERRKSFFGAALARAALAMAPATPIIQLPRYEVTPDPLMHPLMMQKCSSLRMHLRMHPSAISGSVLPA